MKNLTAKDIMVTDVLSAEKGWSIDHLVSFLIEHSITGAPVLSAEGELQGVVSLTDIARNRNLIEQPEKDEFPHDYYLDVELNRYSNDVMDLVRIQSGSVATVADIMTPVVFSVSLDTPVRHVAEDMIRGRIHRVFVTDGKRLVGIITTLDMLKAVKEFG